MKKIFVWSRWVDDVFLGTKPPVAQGGAELQMSFWAKILAEKNFKVYTFSWRRNVKYDKIYNVNFLWLPWVKKIGIIWLPLKFIYVLLVRPDYLIIRSFFDLRILVWLKKYVGYQMIYMLASDRNLDISDKNIQHSWQKYLLDVECLVVQNEFQFYLASKLFKNSNLKIVQIPNIFDKRLLPIDLSGKDYDFIWVGNIKKNKRISWFLSMAEKMPNFKFGIIGANQDQVEFNRLEISIKKHNNIQYLGYLDVRTTTQLIAKAKILVSTSLVEGFPNTFLQAWSLNIPVLSTVDPSSIINENYLGFSVDNIEDMISKAWFLLSSDDEYSKVQDNIKNYFDKFHSPEACFKLFAPLLLND